MKWYFIIVLICISLIISIFLNAYWPFVCLLWRNVCLRLLPIFLLDCLILLLSYMSSLYILEIKTLLVSSFANIFSQSDGCLFILLMVFFDMLKFVNLIKLHLFVIILIALGDWPKKTLIWFMSRECFACALFQEFYGVLCLNL